MTTETAIQRAENGAVQGGGMPLMRPAPAPLPPEILVEVYQNNLEGLTATQLGQYIICRCQADGLDPTQKPYDLIRFQNKIQLYPNVNWAAQVADKRNISSEFTKHEQQGDHYVVVCKAWLPNGRSLERRKLIPVKGIQGEAYANAVMKCESSAFRRAIRALVGAADSDRDFQQMPGARMIRITEGGELQDAGPAEDAPALPAPPPPLLTAREALEAIRLEWDRQEFPPFTEEPGKSLFRDYSRRALGRDPVRSGENPDAFAADLRTVLSDLLERSETLRMTYAQERSKRELDANKDAEKMRREWSEHLGWNIDSRKHVTARELQMVGDRPRAAAVVEDPYDGDAGAVSPTSASEPAPEVVPARKGRRSEPAPAAEPEPDYEAAFRELHTIRGGRPEDVTQCAALLLEDPFLEGKPLTPGEWERAFTALRDRSDLPTLETRTRQVPLAFQT